MITINFLWILINTIVTPLIIYLTQLFITDTYNRKDNVKIFYKKIHSTVNSSHTWGNIDNKSFCIPLWIEIHNTKNKPEILRDLNLYLYNKNKKLIKMKQIQSLRDKIYGYDTSYSFNVKSNRIEHFNLLFLIKKSDIPGGNFDAIKLGYYDTKDNLIDMDFIVIKDPWSNERKEIDQDWIRLK